MPNFLAELRRRNIFRVGAAYAVVAWTLLQLVNNLTPALRLPEWASSLVVVLLMVGFPIALIFTWAHELSPAIDGSARASNSKLDWFLASALVVVFALVMYQQFAPARPAESPQAQAAPPGRPSAAQTGAISVAVLPFVNLSSDAEQEFFSDGMTEEITSALAKVPGLIVIGRTSAFAFKGQNQDLRMIGQALGTTHLIEGSVRKAGTRVRITAQLIIADSGAHLWTENYDRELSDIFAVQEDIATAIAAALRVPLGLKPGQMLISSRIADPDIYEQYLRERAQRRDSSRRFPATRDTLEAVVARAPAFAPGWATLAGAYRGDAVAATARGDFKTHALLTDKEEAAARKAIQLDPNYAGGYSELAAVQTRRGKWAEAEDLYKRALSLDPNDYVLLNVYSQTMASVGRLKEGLRVREQMRALEPLAPDNPITARIMLFNGQIDASIALLEPDLSTGVQRNLYLAQAYAAKGRFAEAADTLLRITQIDRRSVEDAARLLRSAPGKTDQPAKLPALVGELNFVYAYVGATERMLENPEQSAREGNSIGVQTVWRPAAAPLRKTERFKTLMRNAGLVEYWRARGWPDLCHPTTGDDFECD